MAPWSSALFFNSCYFHNVDFFPLWYAPALPPEFGGSTQIGGRGGRARWKNFPALCAGVCAPNFKTVSAPMQLLTGNSQVRPLQRWKTTTRPSRLQSRNRPIFLFLSLFNFDLKPLTDFADIVSWSSMFQRLTTLSEKWRSTDFACCNDVWPA